MSLCECSNVNIQGRSEIHGLCTIHIYPVRLLYYTDQKYSNILIFRNCLIMCILLLSFQLGGGLYRAGVS